MPHHAPPPRTTVEARASSGPAASARVLTLLVALAVACGAAFVLAPPPLAAAGTSGGGFADQRSLIGALKPAFVDYWDSGKQAFPPDLARVVDYWRLYHAVKAVSAALLLLVLVVLAVRLWRALLRAGDRAAGTRAGLCCAWALATLLSAVAVTLLMAGVQGAIAPFSSAISMLSPGTSDERLSTAVTRIRQQLTGLANANASTNASTSRHAPPAVETMVGDFGRYHAVMAVLTAIVLLTLVGLSLVTWRRFARAGTGDRRTKRMSGSLGVLLAAFTVVTALVLVANVGTAENPAPGLLAFFNGGW